MKEYSCCKICEGEIKLINKKYNLVECVNCKLIFCKSIFSQHEFIDVYNELYNKENSHYERHSKDEFNKILNGHSIKVGFNRSRLIKKTVLNGKCKSVLEIGSGVGFIGTYIRNHNDAIKYTGVELDKEAFEKSKILNLNTINGDFSVIEKIESNFDVIMMWEVIEHLQDLKLFLELAYKKLNTNGKIILSTPNYNKIYNYPNREEDQIFQDLPPIHLNFFTPQNIKNIFEIHQFKNCIVNVKKLPYLQVSSFVFYINVLKSFFNKYQGTTIYFEATKK
ncbi:class I SAM-dependent methyltransferase [Flavobacterium luteum]|uniref:Class I SAM-dependent methyltransferase n=1 Tax=Flavobacterium luteum TaxID=2026654 RepID=A0A7J5AHT4_9FLAO|nr:class I SAM-dependent methyltransferase [Flavobacterium luteum]KAB1156559.1 class I SAM-dependent methyltransferase [Flavobacterium luteum]